MIAECMDCSGEIDGKRVEFKIPDFDIDTLDLGKLKSDSKYLEQVHLLFWNDSMRSIPPFSILKIHSCFSTDKNGKDFLSLLVVFYTFL